MRITEKRIIVLLCTFAAATLLTGCATDIMDNTSTGLGLYKSVNEYGQEIIVNTDGERNPGYALDSYGNIVDFSSDEVVILNRNTEEYTPLQQDETVTDEIVYTGQVITETENNTQCTETVATNPVIQESTEIVPITDTDGNKAVPIPAEEVDRLNNISAATNENTVSMDNIYTDTFISVPSAASLPVYVQPSAEPAMPSTAAAYTGNTETKTIQQDETVTEEPAGEYSAEPVYTETEYRQENGEKALPAESPEPEEIQDISHEPVHEHKWDSGTVTKEADCLKDGIMTYTCLECFETKEEKIPAYGHSFSGCRCVRCNYQCTEHNMEITEYVPNDCYTYGRTVRKCTVCGYTEVENTVPVHSYDSSGVCTICGYKDSDIYRAHGRYLAGTTLSEYEKMTDIVNYVADNCHGDCIQCSYAAICAANECGLEARYRYVNSIDCPVSGLGHEQSIFDASGYCPYCGMGNNHHWVRFTLSDGTWYEYDIQAFGTWCPGPDTEIHSAYFNR